MYLANTNDKIYVNVPCNIITRPINNHITLRMIKICVWFASYSHSYMLSFKNICSETKIKVYNRYQINVFEKGKIEGIRMDSVVCRQGFSVLSISSSGFPSIYLTMHTAYGCINLLSTLYAGCTWCCRHEYPIQNATDCVICSCICVCVWVIQNIYRMHMHICHGYTEHRAISAREWHQN